MNSYFLDFKRLRGRELAKGVIARPVLFNKDAMVILFEIYSSVPRHKHSSFQFGVILGGRGRFSIGGEIRDVKKGTFYYIPSNVEHEVKVIEAPLYALDVFMPPRLDYAWMFEDRRSENA